MAKKQDQPQQAPQGQSQPGGPAPGQGTQQGQAQQPAQGQQAPQAFAQAMQQAGLDQQKVQQATQLAQAQNFPLDRLQALTQQFGTQVVSDIIDLASSGLSLDWSVQALEHFGPLVVGILKGFKQQMAQDPGLQQAMQGFRLQAPGQAQQAPQGPQQGIQDQLRGPMARLLLTQVRGLLPALVPGGPALIMAQSFFDGLIQIATGGTV